MLGAHSVENPALSRVVADDETHAYAAAELGGRVDLDHFDKAEHARTHQTRASSRQLVLGLYESLEQRGEGYLHRARARWALARYLRETVAPVYSWRPEYLELAKALEQARQHGLWGVGDLHEPDADESTAALALEWTGRAGQVKLCPDDAREESARASSLYVPRIEELIGEGCEVRYCVFTVPNSPMGFLRADLETVFARFRREILLRRDDGRLARSLDERGRTFGYIRGAVATVEAPLSRHGDWNVHLNVILVCGARPDYRALREAWGANVEFQTVPTGAGAAALRELIKYPLKAVSLKSEEKARAAERGDACRDLDSNSPPRFAPPVIEWPADAFHEWWSAHKGFRRTRSWGELYAGKLEDRRGRVDKLGVEWLGRVFLSPSGFRAEAPALDSRERDYHPDLFAEPSPQRELTFAELQAASDFFNGYDLSRDAAGACDVDLILGNKSAAESSETGTGPPPES